MPRPRSADPILAPAGHVALLLHERVRGRGKSVSGIGEHDETEIDVARRASSELSPGRRRRASSKRISATKPMPTIAVDTSTSMIIHNGIRLTRAAAITGEAMLIAVCNVPLIALTRSNHASGAICGMNDCTAGVWIPPPAERMTRTTRISPVSPQPTAILADRHMVTAAMTASGNMTNSLRFHLSAQTPPNTETIACGRAAATIATVMTMPEFDRKTRYQRIAYCTTLEPNSDSVCSTVCRPIRCITGKAVHVVLVPTPRSWITACLPLRAAAHHVRRQGRADRRARQRPSDVQGRALLGGQGPMCHAVRHDRP